jgi:hypothetical protein
MAHKLQSTGRLLMASIAIAVGTPAVAASTPFIVEGAAPAAASAAVPMLRSSSVVTLGDDTVTHGTMPRMAAPTPAAYNAVPAMSAPPLPTVVPPPLPALPVGPSDAAPTLQPMAPMATSIYRLDRRSYKRALKQKRALDKAMGRCQADCRTLLAQGGAGHGYGYPHGGYAPSGYFGAPMQPHAPVVTRGDVPGMSGASYVQTQYGGQYSNGYYYPGQTVTKITIDPGTMVVTQPAPAVTTYYAVPARAATPRRAKAVRYRSKIIRR